MTLIWCPEPFLVSSESTFDTSLLSFIYLFQCICLVSSTRHKSLVFCLFPPSTWVRPQYPATLPHIRRLWLERKMLCWFEWWDWRTYAWGQDRHRYVSWHLHLPIVWPWTGFGNLSSGRWYQLHTETQGLSGLELEEPGTEAGCKNRDVLDDKIIFRLKCDGSPL